MTKGHALRVFGVHKQKLTLNGMLRLTDVAPEEVNGDNVSELAREDFCCWLPLLGSLMRQRVGLGMASCNNDLCN